MPVAAQETTDVVIQDIQKVEPVRFGHRAYGAGRWFTIPSEDGRGMAIAAFLRAEPSGERVNSPKEIPLEDRKSTRHRHNVDKVGLKLKFPLADSGLDPIEPIDGDYFYQPEGTWYGPYLSNPETKSPDRVAPANDGIWMFGAIQTEGLMRDPMIPMEETNRAIERRLAEDPTIDLTKRDGYVLAVDAALGRPSKYPKVPRARVQDDEDHHYLVFPVLGYPWYPSPTRPGISVKPLNEMSGGPRSKLVKLEKGAEIPGGVREVDRLAFVYAGQLRYGDEEMLTDLHILFTRARAEVQPIVAEERSLLWVLEWQPADAPLPHVWDE